MEFFQMFLNNESMINLVCFMTFFVGVFANEKLVEQSIVYKVATVSSGFGFIFMIINVTINGLYKGF